MSIKKKPETIENAVFVTSKTRTKTECKKQNFSTIMLFQNQTWKTSAEITAAIDVSRLSFLDIV